MSMDNGEKARNTPLDVLIVNPNTQNQVYQDLGQHLTAIETPVWAGLLANSLRQNYDVQILDAEAEGLTPDETVKRIADCRARLIVIAVYGHQPSASTQNMDAAAALAKAIKAAEPGCKLLMVGNHVSALPERTLTETEADFVCQGEGPYTLAGLLSIDWKDPGQYAKVPGLWYRRDGRACFSYPAPLVSRERLALDLPGVAYDLLPMAKYRAHNWHCFGTVHQRQPYASLYTSLGCPFQCNFCCINAVFGKPGYRYWNPEFIVGQFELLARKYNVKNIKIADELFVLNENHFLSICKGLAERNYALNLWAYARVDSVKPSHLDLLKAAGVNWLALGIESGNEPVRNGVHKGGFSQAEIRRIVRQIQESGINVIGNFIFGLPNDNLDTMRETLELALELNCEMVNFYAAMAYPGSRLYEQAIKDGWPLPETWTGYSQHAYESMPLPTRHLTSGQVLAFRDYAWKTYFTNPSYLEMVKRKFGRETHDHIVAMTKYSLPRKFGADA